MISDKPVQSINQSKTWWRPVLLSGLCSAKLFATELHLTPDTCVVQRPQTDCVLNFKVRFSEPQEQAYCLWAQHWTKALWCSTGQGEQELQLQISLRQTLVIEMRDPQQQLLARSELKLAVYQPAQTRRRRGLGWNLL